MTLAEFLFGVGSGVLNAHVELYMSTSPDYGAVPGQSVLAHGSTTHIVLAVGRYSFFSRLGSSRWVTTSGVSSTLTRPPQQDG